MLRRAQEFAVAEITALGNEPGRLMAMPWATHEEVRSWGAAIPENPGKLRRWQPNRVRGGKPAPDDLCGMDDVGVVIVEETGRGGRDPGESAGARGRAGAGTRPTTACHG